MSLLAAFAITLLLAPAAAQLSLDDDPKNIFEYDGEEYANYLSLLENFPGIESDFVLIIPGDAFELTQFNRVLAISDSIAALAETQHVMSVATLPAVEDALIDPFSLERASQVDIDTVQQIALTKEKDTGHIKFLVSKDSDAHLLVVRTKVGMLTTTQDLMRYKKKMKAAVDEVFGDQKVGAYIGGAPAMKVSVYQSLRTDTLKLNIIGALLATVVGVFLFRSARILVVITLGPAMGAVWALGLMQILGDQISVFTSMLLPLLFVVGYTNAAHIIFGVLKGDIEQKRWVNSWQSLSRVSKACFVSALTTGIGFASLMLSRSTLIADFGMYSAIGTLLVFLAVVLVTPALAALLRIRSHANTPRILAVGSNTLGSLSILIRTHHNVIAKIGLVACVGLMLLAFQNEPEYRFRENFAPDSEFYQVIKLGDQKLSGIMSANVMLGWSEHQQLELDRLFSLEQSISALAQEVFTTDRVVSLSTLLKQPARSTIRDLDDLTFSLPESLARQFLNIEAKTSLVTVPVRDLGSQALIPLFDQFQSGLDRLSSAYPEFSVVLTGIAPLAMHASERNIREMALSLVAALIAIYFVIALVLRSIRLGLICMLPNIIPIAGVASLLVLTGTPLYYNSVLVFTICLGIAVDDTVHFILRYRTEYMQTGSVQQAVENSIQQIGLVLFFTSCILGAGFFSLILSSISVVSLMGALSFTALGLALIADLLFLPTLLSTNFGVKALQN